ncbi:MAG: tripartite tricarboxylate transporter substrate binding protein [Rhizobiales bacterium]|nr:tripartite tricarboxylate transporter substrate binding protein [Hyphomicrobiales bacterium]
MLRTMSRKFGAMALVAVLTATALPALAQTYPSAPIHLIVAYAPGGTGDVVARVVAPKLSAALGQTVVVENRAGASGAIGARSVVAAAPDGHTLLVGQTAEVAINQHWLKGLNYDPDKDLQPVALMTVVPLALVVPAKAPYSTMAEYLAAMRDGKHTFASAGTGTPGHFAGELLKAKTKANLTHVPYKGAGPALNDLLGGHVEMYFPGMPAAMPLVKNGLVKVLGVSSAKRSAIAPDVPTVAEAAGIKDFSFTLWQGIFAPHGTPPAIVAKLNSEINKVLNDPETKKKLLDAGAEVEAMSVEQFRAFVAAESGKYLAIIKETGVTAE